VESLSTTDTSWLSEAATAGAPKVRSRVMVVSVVVFAAFAVIFTVSWLFRSARPNEGIQLFVVERRSFPVTLEEKGELEAANSIDIRCELEGRSTLIYLIDEGAHVQKGDLLVELASDEIDEQLRDIEIKVAMAQAAHEAAVKEHEILLSENASKIRKAELALEMAQLALKRYQEGEKVELKQDADLALEKAKSVLKRAQDYRKDSEELYKQGYITQIELENDRFAQYEGEIELKKATLALEVLEKYTFPMDLREKQSEVDEASKELERTKKSATASEAKSGADVSAKKSELALIREKLDKFQDQKSKAKIHAPADGLVVYAREGSWHRTEKIIEEGSQVFERQSLIELPDTSSMKVLIRVHETQIEHLNIGAPAVVEIEGHSGRQFKGKVSKIAVLADSQNRWLNPNLKEYQTEVLLDGEFADLKPGATARVEVQMAQLNDVLTVPVQSVFVRNGLYYVFVDGGGDLEPVEVEVGLSSPEYVEIKSGLSEGQQIRLAVTKDEQLLLPGGEGNGHQRKKPGRGERPPRIAGAKS